jgi:hypothetical protein
MREKPWELKILSKLSLFTSAMFFFVAYNTSNLTVNDILDHSVNLQGVQEVKDVKKENNAIVFEKEDDQGKQAPSKS